MEEGSVSSGWPVWLFVSLLIHGVLLVCFLIWGSSLFPRPAVREIVIPITLVEAGGEAPAEYELSPEILHFRKKTHPRVREVLAVEAEVRALAPPPEEVRLTRSSSGGGFSFEVRDATALDGFTFSGSRGGLAATGTGVGNSKGGVGTFEEYVGGLRQVGLEVMFVVDATGSMGWLIDSVRERITTLSDWIRDLVPVTRFGVVAYRDADDPEFLTRIQPLSLSVGKLRRFLEGLEPRGGGDVPEGVTAGLRVAIEKAGWTRDTKKVIVIIGDAPPHPEEMEQAMALASAFREQGGSVTTVDVSFDANPEIAAARLGKRVDELVTVGSRELLPEFRQVARAGGGDASSLEGDTLVVRQLAVLIFGKRWAEAVEPLLGRF
jgi:hypothetical protein